MKKKQIAINLITNFLSMLIMAGINFWITPVMIKALGYTAYGYVGVITNLLSFFTVITYVLNSMVGRFYMLEQKAGNEQGANEYISSAFYACVILAVILLPIVLLITWKLEIFIKIESCYLIDVKLAFLIAALTFLTSTLVSVMSTGTYSANRLEINNLLKIGAGVFRFLLLWVLFTFGQAKIWFISGSNLLQNILLIIFGYLSFKWLVPQVSFSIRNFRKSRVWQLMKAGGFNSVILLGTTLMSQVSLLIGNRMLPGDQVGLFSSMLLIPTTMKSVMTALSNAFSPSTLEIYALEGKDALKDYSNQVIKFCGIIIGWPICIATAMGVPVFRLWLGGDFSNYRIVFAILMLTQVSDLAVSQLNVVQQAVNELKIPAVASILCGILCLGLSAFFVGVCGWGLIGLALGSTLPFMLRNTVFNPIYTAIITGQKWYVFFKSLFKPVLMSAIVYIIGIIPEVLGFISSFFALFLACFLLSILYWGLTWLASSAEDKRTVIRFIKRKSSKAKE